MKYIALLILLFCQGIAFSQDTPKSKTPIPPKPDTTKLVHTLRGIVPKHNKRKVEYFKDTIRREPRKFDSTLFTQIVVPSTSDYAEDLGKIYQLLSAAPDITSSFVRLPSIKQNMELEDSALMILQDRLFQNERTFNVRNLQMFNTLLDAIGSNTVEYAAYLNRYDTALDGVREDITDLRDDTLMRNIFRDSSLKAQFQPQLQQLKLKWRQVDSLVTENGKIINTLKSQATAHAITIGELTSKVDAELKAVGSRAFGKERPFLWEADAPNELSAENSKEIIKSEKQLTNFYFSSTRSKRVWLIALVLLFFYWVWNNFRILKKLGKLQSLVNFQFTYVGPYPVGAALIFMLSLAPLFDLHAPAIYVETIQFALMLVLTTMLYKRIPKKLFFGWCMFMLLFLLLPVIRIMDLQRWGYFIIDAAGAALGIYYLWTHGRKHGKWIFFAIGFYTLLNVLAIICNLFGRVTLTQILSYTAVYSFAQTISLGIFVSIIKESVLLQIHTSRTRKKYPEGFDYSAIAKSILRFGLIIAVVLWLIVFTINMNLFDAINDFLTAAFSSVRRVGNFSFTIGGILLFFSIIWVANFLQKYIGYFFGDTGDDAAFDDKGQRSRLMITRLILLIAGFLLAVAASGLAVDRITVILGALGVGIGLGLQNIVNNFVSGIILIFDRPLRIGDTVDIGDKRGRVKEISIRTSTLLTAEGAEVIIPNGDVLSHNIVNWTLSDNHVRQTMVFTIDKPIDSGTDQIKEIVTKNGNVLADRIPEITDTAINATSHELKVIFWIKDFNVSSITNREVRAAITEYLEKSGITLL